MIVVRLVMSLVVLVTGMVLSATRPAHAASAPVIHAQARTAVAPKVTKAEPVMMRMVDCESYDIQPCYTYDDGAWRMVISYKPYRMVKLSVCKAEDGGPKLPCIWKKNNRVSKGQPVTRNVFMK
jgi:hypothetical protein